MRAHLPPARGSARAQWCAVASQRLWCSGRRAPRGGALKGNVLRERGAQAAAQRLPHMVGMRLAGTVRPQWRARRVSARATAAQHEKRQHASRPHTPRGRASERAAVGREGTRRYAEKCPAVGSRRPLHKRRRPAVYGAGQLSQHNALTSTFACTSRFVNLGVLPSQASREFTRFLCSIFCISKTSTMDEGGSAGREREGKAATMDATSGLNAFPCSQAPSSRSD